MKLRNDWIRLHVLTIVATVGIIAFVACSKGGGGQPEGETTPGQPGACGPGLAAVDLSGICRCIPQATMGALEAEGACP